MFHYEKLQLYLRLGLRSKKYIVYSNQSQWLKPYVEFNKQKRKETEKNCDKNGKVLYKLMNNAVWDKNWETESM